VPISGGLPCVAGEQLEILDAGDEQVLDALPPLATPPGALHAMEHGSDGEAALGEPLALLAVCSCGFAVGLAAGFI